MWAERRFNTKVNQGRANNLESLADNTPQRICNAAEVSGTMSQLSGLSIPSWNRVVHLTHRFVAVCCLLLSAALSAQANDKLSQEELAFFETKIRPVLVEHCYACHSADSDELGGKLLLDSAQAIRKRWRVRAID